MYATNRPGCIQWGCTWDQIGRASTTGSHAIALIRAICGNLDVPGGDGMPGPRARASSPTRRWKPTSACPRSRRPSRSAPTSSSSPPGPATSSSPTTRNARGARRLPAEWFCEAHGPSVFKAILTGDPYQVRALIVNATNPRRTPTATRKMTLAGAEAVRVPGDRRLLDDPDGAVRRLRVPGGRRARASDHRHALRRDRLHHGRPPRHAAQVRPPHRHGVLAQAGPGLRTGSRHVAVGDRRGGVLPHPGAPRPAHLRATTISSTTTACTIRRCTRTSSSRTAASGLRLGQGRVQLHRSCASSATRACPPTSAACENEIDTPEIAEEYPIVLTTGGGFMPYHHSEHFQMQGDPLPVSRPVLLDQPGAGREAQHRLRRLVLDRDAPRPHQDARERGARGASQRGVRAARLVVPRARRLGRPGQPVRLPRSPTSTC